MTFDVDIDGQLHHVAIERAGDADARGGRFRLTVRAAAADGTPAPSTGARAGVAAIDVDARATDLGLSLLFPDGRSVDVALTEQNAGAWFVQLPHTSCTAIVDGRRLVRGAAGSGGGGPQRLVAPMPGRVVRVLVKPGDEVAAKQALVVVEAMKMENELSSARPGRVKEVAVAEGASVEAGRLLVVVE